MALVVDVIAADMVAGHQHQQACAGPKPVVVKGPAGEAEAAEVAILLAPLRVPGLPNCVIARQVEMVSPGVQSVHAEAGGVYGTEPHQEAAVGLVVAPEFHLVEVVALSCAGGVAPAASFSP